jgi:hypothetical protein
MGTEIAFQYYQQPAVSPHLGKGEGIPVHTMKAFDGVE